MLSLDFTQNLIDNVPPIMEVDAGGNESDFFDHIDQGLLFKVSLERRWHIGRIAQYGSRHHWL
jgi:hypothetical protein